MARLIDADAFEKLLMNLPDEVLCEDCCYVVVNEMRNQPTIEPKQEWIRAKEKLPRKGESVLVYWDDGFDIGAYVGGEVGDDVYWMPLPEPPEKEK